MWISRSTSTTVVFVFISLSNKTSISISMSVLNSLSILMGHLVRVETLGDVLDELLHGEFLLSVAAQSGHEQLERFTFQSPLDAAHAPYKKRKDKTYGRTDKTNRQEAGRYTGGQAGRWAGRQAGDMSYSRSWRDQESTSPEISRSYTAFPKCENLTY